LIPGPQGPSSGSLANFSGNTNGVSVGASGTANVYFTNTNYVNISLSASVPGGSSLDTLTFGLSGKYLFQYNVNGSMGSISLSGTVNGIHTSFGTQTVSGTSTYGCSVIQDLTVGDKLSLVLTGVSINWTFASLTIIKL
jgi:hypothetical protein